MALSAVPTLHQTDCFHPHEDPDDHWDLATQFALAYQGWIDLKGVLIDYPPASIEGNPAIGAVSQLNVITGRAVPVGVGSESKAACDADIAAVAAQTPLNGGLRLIVDTLEQAPAPVTIHIVGSSRDVAVAATAYPDLFREKCRAIYLNAGSSAGSTPEYNVALDPFSYSKLFAVPCPLYWMPCFHDQDRIFTGGPHGTFWQFRQGEILPHLSDRLQRYFTYALGRNPDHRWLSHLCRPTDRPLLQELEAGLRNMWCTAGFLHAAGKTVTVDGEIADADAPHIRPVFDCVPVSVSCDADGRTRWEPASSDTRFIFRVRDTDRYSAAMTAALRTLLSRLP